MTHTAPVIKEPKLLIGSTSNHLYLLFKMYNDFTLPNFSDIWFFFLMLHKKLHLSKIRMSAIDKNVTVSEWYLVSICSYCFVCCSYYSLFMQNYIKMRKINMRLSWYLPKDDTQILKCSIFLSRLSHTLTSAERQSTYDHMEGSCLQCMGGSCVWRMGGSCVRFMGGSWMQRMSWSYVIDISSS